MVQSRWRLRVPRVVFILLLALVITAGWTDPTAHAQPHLQLAVKSAILVEAETGKILYKYNENLPLPPASMTKMMTEYLVLEAIKQGKISWEDRVTTDAYGYWMGRHGGSRVFLNLGEVRTVRELYTAMAVYSANDATVMLARHVAGSEAAFVEQMNKKAKALGMTHTHFVTSTGFPLKDIPAQFRPPGNGDNQMSARDAAILARRLLMDYPEVLEFSSIPKAVFREGEANPIQMANWNWMLPGLVAQYPGVDGLKTGHTEQAGYCFTGTAQRDGMRLISVVMGTSSELARFQETAKLFDYGFSQFEVKTLFKGKEPVKGYETVPVTKGVDLEVPVVPERDVVAVVRKGDESAPSPRVSVAEVVAPVKQGQAVGTIKAVAASGGDEYLTPEAGAVKLIAQEDVEEAGWLRLFFRSVKNALAGLFSSIVEAVTGAF